MVPYLILSQPSPITGITTLAAAYRPLYFLVVGDSATDPNLPMYADVYIGPNAGSAVYYKTLTSYPNTYSILNPTAGFYEFDVQDALQEYLQTLLPEIPVTGMTLTSGGTPPYAFNTVIVYFRGSSFSGGLLVPEGPVPVQGTATSLPVAGGGKPCFSFLAFNSSILPYYENYILFNHLESALAVKRLNFTSVGPTRIYPMSNYPLSPSQGTEELLPDDIVSIPVYLADQGGFPLTVIEFIHSGSLDPLSRNCRIGINASNPDGSITASAWLSGTITVDAPRTYFIPTGLSEISTIVGGTLTAALLDPNSNLYYQVFLFDLDSSHYCFFTPWYKPSAYAIERKRLAFQNAYGQFEWVSFVRNSEQFKSTSSEQFVPYSVQFLGLNALRMGHKRMAITGTDEMTYTAVFNEIQLPWIKELIMSPIVMIQSEDATPVLQPFKILDSNISSKKTVAEGRFNYVVTIKVAPAWDYITLRN